MQEGSLLLLVAVNFVKFAGALLLHVATHQGQGKEIQCQGIACSYGVRHQDVKKSGAIDVGRL